MVANPSDQLFAFQQTSVDFCIDDRFSIIGHDQGLGKTAIACRALHAPAIVVCPAALIINWQRELSIWRRDLKPGAVQVVSYANPDIARILRKSKHYTLVLDEVHYIKNPEAQRTRNVCHAIRRAFHCIVMSGTLVPNRPIEVWPVLYSMGITKLRYKRFAYKYADAYMNKWGELDVRGHSNLEELSDLIAPHSLRYTKQEVLPELPLKTWRVIALNLPLKREERVKNNPVAKDLARMDVQVAMEAMADLIHQHGLRKLPLALEYIRDILQTVNKVIVFAYHRDVLDALMSDLAEFNPVMVRGGMSPKKKQSKVDRFQDDQKCRVLCGQITAAGVGYTMTAGSHVIFVEGSWVGAVMDQAGDRAHRIGQTKNVTCDVLVIHKSIDEWMMRRCLEKKDVAGRIVPDNEFSDPNEFTSLPF